MSKDSFRNRLAWRIANWALNHIADEDYRTLIEIIVDRGMYAYRDKASR